MTEGDFQIEHREAELGQAGTHDLARPGRAVVEHSQPGVNHSRTRRSLTRGRLIWKIEGLRWSPSVAQVNVLSIPMQHPPASFPSLANPQRRGSHRLTAAFKCAWSRRHTGESDAL